MFVSDLVQVKEGLVDRLLQFQCCLHGILATAPLVFGRFFYVLEDNSAATVVLELHEGPGVFHLLVRGLPEIFRESGKSQVITLEVERLKVGRKRVKQKKKRKRWGEKTCSSSERRAYHGEVAVTSVELQVDLLVDALLALGSVVLAHLTHGGWFLLITKYEEG